MKSRSHRPWVQAEIDYLTAYYPNPDNEIYDIAKQLGRSENAVIAKAEEIGIRRAGRKTTGRVRGNVRDVGMPKGAVKSISHLHACKDRAFIDQQRQRGVSDPVIMRQLGIGLDKASTYGLMVPQGPQDEGTDHAGV